MSFLSRRPLLSRVTLWIIKRNIITPHFRIITSINTRTAPLIEELRSKTMRGRIQWEKWNKGRRRVQSHLGFFIFNAQQRYWLLLASKSQDCCPGTSWYIAHMMHTHVCKHRMQNTYTHTPTYGFPVKEKTIRELTAFSWDKELSEASDDFLVMWESGGGTNAREESKGWGMGSEYWHWEWEYYGWWEL